MRRYSVQEIRKWFSQAVNEVAFGKDRVVISRHGKDVAAVVPIEDFERLEKLDAAAVKRGKMPVLAARED